MDHCIVGWNHKIVVLTSIQGNAYKNVTDEATLDWLGHGAHPVGSTVAIGIHGNTAATVETITEQGKEAAVYLLMFLAAITAALIWFGWWRLRSRRAHPATGHEPRSPDR